MVIKYIKKPCLWYGLLLYEINDSEKEDRMKNCKERKKEKYIL